MVQQQAQNFPRTSRGGPAQLVLHIVPHRLLQLRNSDGVGAPDDRPPHHSRCIFTQGNEAATPLLVRLFRVRQGVLTHWRRGPASQDPQHLSQEWQHQGTPPASPQ